LYEPQVNRTYAEMAAHYGTAALPTRPRRSRDKAKVEACVLIVERWLIGRLRSRVFHSLAELNAAIGELLLRLNEQRTIRRLGRTRRQLLEELDRPELKPLPIESYVFAEWHLRRVGIDYHVDVDGYSYSVPYSYARAEVEVRLTARTVEIFARGGRIATHVRSSGNHKHSTIADQMPSSHRRYADWTIDRIRREAASVGPATAALCELILERRPHPEQGLPSLSGNLAHGVLVRRRASRSRHDWGLEPLDAAARHDLLEILEERYGRRFGHRHQPDPRRQMARPDRRSDPPTPSSIASSTTRTGSCSPATAPDPRASTKE
jgi:transposase